MTAPDLLAWTGRAKADRTVGHTELMDAVRVAVSKTKHARLFGNPVGEAWTGDARRDGNAVTIYRPRRIPYGLAPGSGDLIGATSITITADMVGQTVAVFTSTDIKTGRATLSEAQEKWHEFVLRMGGRSCVTRSLEDALRLVTM
jgi:hypothetical protein